MWKYCGENSCGQMEGSAGRGTLCPVLLSLNYHVLLAFFFLFSHTQFIYTLYRFLKSYLLTIFLEHFPCQKLTDCSFNIQTQHTQCIYTYINRNLYSFSSICVHLCMHEYLYTSRTKESKIFK